MNEPELFRENNFPVNLKIGAPPYLNTKPLVYGLESHVKFAVPSRLVQLFRKRQLDVVLAPVVEFFRNERALLLPEIAIATQGVVETVRLFYKNSLRSLKRVGIDSSSRTSELLLRLILEEKQGIKPEYIRTSAHLNFEESIYDGLLVIGDPAFEAPKKVRSLDLGKTWAEWTGLPFVFACWMVDREVDLKGGFQQFLEARQAGEQNLAKIVQQASGISPKLAQKYLTQNITYQLGPKELEGLRLFQAKCFEKGLIETKRELAFAKV